MNDNLHTGLAGQNMIKSYESLSLKAYQDTIKNGVPDYAIGYGHTNTLGAPKVTKDMVITEEEANQIFVKDLEIFENKVKSKVKVPLNQNQFDALVGFAYNVSTAHLESMIEASGLNDGHYAGVPTAIFKYIVSGGKILRGLIKRRISEGALWNTPIV